MGYSSTQCELFDGPGPGSPSGRTCLECSPTTRGEALLLWLERWQGYGLTYRTVAGEAPVFSSARKPLLNGGFWMRNSSAWPSGAAVCSLSAILETGKVDRRYYLSPKACAGILRRAEKRGKALPTTLRQALQAVAGESNGGGIAEDKTR